MQTKSIFILFIIASLAISGCGSSPEEIATMTAEAWTPTPPPTATATPIPDGLTVQITDQDGNPVAGASVVFPESGDDQPVVADSGGQVSWNDLPGTGGILSISAQGYLPAQQSLNLERGPNEVIVTLQADPYGLLPSAACAAGETLVYVEDFQDGTADGWPEIQFNAPGWAVEPDPLDGSDFVISAHHSEMNGEGPIISNLQELVFENAAWRIRYRVADKLAGNNGFSFNWLHAREPIDMGGVEVFDSRYQLPVNQNDFEIRRLQQPVLNFSVARGKKPKDGEWHYVEIATYQGYTEVWFDGVRNMTYQDPETLPAGGAGLEIWLMDDTAAIYFDDISICELSAPFTSLAVPAE